jgi:hypothetical protein
VTGNQKDVVSLARGLGFTIDQVEDEEDGSMQWRYLAKLGLADVLERAEMETEEIGYANERQAARRALAALHDAIESCLAVSP